MSSDAQIATRSALCKGSDQLSAGINTSSSTYKNESIPGEFQRLTDADRSKREVATNKRPLPERDVTLTQGPAFAASRKLGPILALRFNRPCIDSLRFKLDHPELPKDGQPPTKCRRLD